MFSFKVFAPSLLACSPTSRGRFSIAPHSVTEPPCPPPPPLAAGVPVGPHCCVPALVHLPPGGESQWRPCRLHLWRVQRHLAGVAPVQEVGQRFLLVGAHCVQHRLRGLPAGESRVTTSTRRKDDQGSSTNGLKFAACCEFWGNQYLLVALAA
jgi:hypothetical protein